ncbi:unnamed protein product [Psylliodes chrysocephalus]|uniref:RING-type domain-containing protein n=1 Tax=Psylliodes chrysocephalus TaxID=3402493 RepID=A0A9P0GHK2_9CUCU|nr:unnamed protein product [Psylliodes chrysocephala]
MEDSIKRPEKIKLTEINPYLTCYLCKGYLIDATTISECLHSFCRSCIIKFLHENSYCPICEVIINKAKPNLKLDKTLQDIVYKLVPELFLREMTRRKQYYQQYPQIVPRLAPEERGEDTERTIFNPHDCISLSMEYVSADSSPDAIKILGSKNGFDKNDQLSPEENQALMKRYLQCPGMCRVDVLKKFVRNKYNVDTSLFHIDILYKRVPLPDHYTLIDIAYIYSWKRNEPMKFFFRITDINKVSERFDYFDSQNPCELIVQLPLRHTRNNGTAASRRKEHAANRKKIKQELQNQANGCDTQKVDINEKKSTVLNGSDKTFTKPECDSIGKQKIGNKENVKVKVEETANNNSDTSEKSPKRFILKIKKDPEKDNSLKIDDNSSAFRLSVTSSEESKDTKNSVTSSSVVKNNIRNQQSDVKNSVYTSITLNRTNNVEIITKIQKVSNKDGPPELNILEQTFKGKEATRKHKKKSEKSLLKYKPKYSKLLNKNKLSKKEIPSTSVRSNTKNITNPSVICGDSDKDKFLANFQLVSKSFVTKKQIKEYKKSPNVDVNKRKPASPAKSSSSPKKAKLDKKSVTRIILQSKPKPNSSPKSCDKLQTPGLQSLIENCKIPSSLSITIKDSSESNKTNTLIPPVKNYIEILKLPDENKETVNDNNNSNKLNFALHMNDDSEQKVDEDLAEIAKSLTEKIPMSTTVSQIVGPKPEFPIPVKTNVPSKFTIQPSPVPEITNKLLNVPKENKLNPRSPQSFQKIFEESIKKPDDDSIENDGCSSESSNEVTSTSNNKRNILEIATQLYKKTKLEHEKSQPQNQIDSTTPKTVPKVPIPRLPNRNSKTTPKYSIFERSDGLQTLTNLHSNALGLNYTISVGPNKTNGIITKKDDVPVKSPLSIEAKTSLFPSPKDLPGTSPRPTLPRNISPGIAYTNSPRNSPKHSPKSSPLIKHMYAPTPNLMMDQLRVNTFSPKINKSSPNLPSSSTSTKSPNSISPKPSTISPQVPSKISPKPSSSSPNSQLSPNQILERYNIQNLAQLTANFNASNFGLTAPGNQLAAFQHAMLLKHFEMQNRQNWLNMNQGPLLQYEKYLQNLQNLKSAQNQLLSNIKEN